MLLPRPLLLPRSLLAAGIMLLVSLSAQAAPLVVEQAQVRAVPPVSDNTAAFLVLHNPGESELVVIDAHSPAAENTELHNHVEADGVMQMRQVADITVPAGGSIELAPGGLHLMLIGLAAPLHEGDRVELTLELDNAESITFEAPVQHIDVSGDVSDHSGHHHD